MKNSILLVLISFIGLSLTASDHENQVRLEKVEIDGRLAWVQLNQNNKILEIVHYFDENQATPPQVFEIEFEDQKQVLEVTDVQTIELVAYSYFSDMSRSIVITVANRGESYQRLLSILETLQYIGISTEHIDIDIVPPHESINDTIALHLKDTSIDYAVDTKLDNPYTLASIY